MRAWIVLDYSGRVCLLVPCDVSVLVVNCAFILTILTHDWSLFASLSSLWFIRYGDWFTCGNPSCSFIFN